MQETILNDHQQNESRTDTSGQEGGAPRVSAKAKLLIALGVVLIAALAGGLRIYNRDTSIEVSPLPTVSVSHAGRGDISVETSLIGTIEPGDVYYVVPKAAGEITAIYVETGSRVSAGDPICDIDNSKSVDAARITLDSAGVNLSISQESASLAKTNLDRMAVLFSTGDISQSSFESYQNSYDQAQAAVDAAKLQLESAQLAYDTQLEYSTVTAPIDGIVQSTDMSINALASSASQVAVITSDASNKLTFSVTERLLGNLAAGDKVTVVSQGTSYEGFVTSVSSMISPTTGLYPIEAAFEGADSMLKGSRVKVYFASDTASDALLADTSWIYYDGGKPYIYTLTYDDDADEGDDLTVAEGHRAAVIHKNAVETGLSDNEKTEILSGIDEDDLIVSSWTSQLYEGARVQVLPES